MITVYEAKCLKDTQQYGITLGQSLQIGDIVLLFGDLGVGKTTLTQSLCLGLEVPSKEYVSSPTFTLINQYNGRYPIYHIDLYRLDNQLAIESLGLEEFLYGRGVTIIEWAEKLFHPETGHPLFPMESRLEIRIEQNTDQVRRISIRPYGLNNRFQ
tara:strand:+ start:70 stop:537 length:468 start_codon:yes stop_codon:yes gene_type:complete